MSDEPPDNDPAPALDGSFGQTLAALADRVEFTTHRRAGPWFRISESDTNGPGPSLDRACGTPVRMDPHHVDLAERLSNADVVRRIAEVGHFCKVKPGKPGPG